MLERRIFILVAALVVLLAGRTLEHLCASARAGVGRRDARYRASASVVRMSGRGDRFGA